MIKSRSVMVSKAWRYLPSPTCTVGYYCRNVYLSFTNGTEYLLFGAVTSPVSTRESDHHKNRRVNIRELPSPPRGPVTLHPHLLVTLRLDP